MKRSQPWLRLEMIGLALSLLLAGCQKSDAPAERAAQPAAAPAPPPPPPPPETSFGKLVKVERAETAALQVMCVPGGGKLKAGPGAEMFSVGDDNVCKGTEKEKAPNGRVFLVLGFEGKSKRDFSEQVTTWNSAPQSHFVSRVDDTTWLEDSTGKKFRKPFLVVTKESRQLAFSITPEAAGLIWHDGKKMAYSLEPHPVALPAPAADAAGAAAKSP